MPGQRYLLPMPFVDCQTARRFSPDKLQKLNLLSTPQMFCDVYCLEPGQEQAAHRHAGASKFYYVLEGRGSFTIDGEARDLGPGGLAWAGPDQEHGVANRSRDRLVLLVAMAPNPGT